MSQDAQWYRILKFFTLPLSFNTNLTEFRNSNFDKMEEATDLY